jgi:hypothetical protein
MASDETTNAGWTDLTKKWQEMVTSSWSQMTKEVVSSDAFATASSATLDASLAWQKQIRQQSGQYMETLDIPKRSDLARLSKQVSGLQGRLLEVEDKLDATLEILRQVAAAAASQSAPVARSQVVGEAKPQAVKAANADHAEPAPKAEKKHASKTRAKSKTRPKT